MKKIDIVVIGAGLYVCGKGTKGFGTILPAIFESKRNNKNIGAIHCVSTSISSSIEFLDKAEKLKKKTGVDIEVSAYPRNDSEANFSYKDLLRDIEKPACAIVSIPDHLHHKVTKDCLESGLHSLVVKPLTPTYSEGQDLVKIAKKNNLYGAVEFHKRWDKSNLLLKDKFQSGVLGDPVNCWVEYSQKKSIPISSFKEWASKTTILQYLGIHYIDIIRFVTRAIPNRVMAIGQKSEIVKYDIDTYDSIQCVIDWEMPNGTKFTQTLLTSWIDPESSTSVSDQKIKFIGTKGRYEADQKERGIRLNTDNDGVEHINPDFCMSYGIENKDIHWRGYGIDSIVTFLNDVVNLENKIQTLDDLKGKRPCFQESLISTVIIEEAHKSLAKNSAWQKISSDLVKTKN
tara:strand:- start:12683 stop:13885 length:1203 start_codon:yes stop_codon:yes gene_type:complete